jgi:hypothetical protein
MSEAVQAVKSRMEAKKRSALVTTADAVAKDHKEVADDASAADALNRARQAEKDGDTETFNKAYDEYVSAANKVWKPQTEEEKATAASAELVGAKHTVRPVPIDAINPNYGKKGKAWRSNCQRCVPCYELARRGYDVTAKPLPAKPTSTDLMYGGRWSNAYKNAEPVHWKDKADCDAIIRGWGEGARAEICVKWKGRSGSGHIFFAEVKDGAVVYSDPQDPAANAEDYFKGAYTDRSRWGKNNEVLRIDNLDFSVRVAECAKPR